MKTLFILLILGSVLCDRKYFLYKKGKLQRGNEMAAEIFGHIELMNEGENNYVELNGLHLGSTRNPFAFMMDLPKMSWDGQEAVGECKNGYWDKKALKLKGKYSVILEGTTIKFKGSCTDSSNNEVYNIEFFGNRTECLVFQPPEPSHRALQLLGEKTSRFKPANILNFAYYDFPYIDALKNCRYFLNKFGKVAPSAKPGYVIVGKDGMHCGVVDHEGTKFIHANPAKKQVTLTPLALAETFFKNGFVFKTVPCKGPHDY